MEPIIFESIKLEDMEILEQEPPLPTLTDSDYGLFQELRTSLHDPYISNPAEDDYSYLNQNHELDNGPRFEESYDSHLNEHNDPFNAYQDYEDVRSVFDEFEDLESGDEPVVVPVKVRTTEVPNRAKRKNAAPPGAVRKSDCPICHKHVRTSNMPRHLRTHAGIHRFRCAVCQVTFIERYAAQQHIIKHHPDAVGHDLVVKIA